MAGKAHGKRGKKSGARERETKNGIKTNTKNKKKKTQGIQKAATRKTQK
jgi:hypothetical protein